ncbi:adhesion G-protein coupled receptor G2 [Nerophis ophidion]|uniref:adhesion G-protein coupled receptor G2 n=1 Tax=Nerophis ophidion TaxID=159077 RepID=UPI002AE05182|nr:adhesion G-protein coupled receptor G2 [Nerophis ophidion]
MSGCKDYPDIQQHFQGVHLECDGTHQRLNSCMVIVEVSGPVDGCSLGPLLKELIGSYAGVTGQTALARMGVCGSPGVPLHRLLASNLSWSAHALLMSDICRHDTALLQCETNQTRAVLLADSCSPSLTLPPAVHEAVPTAATDPDISAGAAFADITTHQNPTQPLAVTTQTSPDDSPVTTVTTLSSHDATFNSTAPLPNGTTVTEHHVTNGTGNEHTTHLNATSTSKRPGPQDNSTLPDDSQTLATTSSNDVAPSAPLIMADMTTNLNNGANLSDDPSHILLTFPAKNDNTTITTAGTIVTSSASPGTKLPPEEQMDKLLERTQDGSQLNSSQVADVVEQLEKLLDAATVSQAVGRKAISIVSQLMEVDPRVLSASSNRIIRLVEDLGLKLVVSDVSVVLSSGSLVLAVQKVDGSNFPEMFVHIYNTKDVELSVTSRSKSRRRDSILGSVYLPSSLAGALNSAEKMQVQRVQFTFYTKPILFQDNTLNKQTVVSPVLASSVANLSVSNLTENVSFTIQNLHPVHANYEVTCAFWDFTGNGGAGGWSSAGCFVVNSTSWGTTCTCNHLTSFAVLLDLSREGVSDPRQAQILTFITYIGCGLSAVFLAATLLTYLSFEKLLRDIPAKILVQLCFSLLFLNLVYLLDGWLALYPAGGLCISTAFFLHYFLLTSFTWAGLEALHMYLSIVQVFTPYLSRYMLKFSLVGWGAPVVVVTVVISVDKDNYGLVTYGRYTDGTSDDFCWLRSDTAFYVGVVTYFLLIFTSCLLVFAVVMVQLSRIKRQNPHNQSPHRGLVTDLRSVVGLVVLLGLAWGFALLAWGPLHLPFVYLFTISNSLQGFLVFVFHCACKENVRRQWRTYLCCGRLRLAKNSEWSRTATRNRNFSATTSSALAPRQLSSRSSSVASNITSSSSVFVDSGLSDGSSSDVILNELHRQTASL